jgi:hypothetical protein
MVAQDVHARTLIEIASWHGGALYFVKDQFVAGIQGQAMAILN